MKNKIYFAPDIFPVFFVVFFLFTIFKTNCNKIDFTQIPKALSVLVLGKNKECFGKPDKFRKFSKFREILENLENSLWPKFIWKAR